MTEAVIHPTQPPSPVEAGFKPALVPQSTFIPLRGPSQAMVSLRPREELRGSCGMALLSCTLKDYATRQTDLLDNRKWKTYLPN